MEELSPCLLRWPRSTLTSERWAAAEVVEEEGTAAAAAGGTAPSATVRGEGEEGREPEAATSFRARVTVCFAGVGEKNCLCYSVDTVWVWVCGRLALWN